MNRTLPRAICAAGSVWLDPVSAAPAGDPVPAHPHHAAARSITPPATIHRFIISILLAACRFLWQVNAGDPCYSASGRHACNAAPGADASAFGHGNRSETGTSDLHR